jgi:hypothetical protein
MKTFKIFTIIIFLFVLQDSFGQKMQSCNIGKYRLTSQLTEKHGLLFCATDTVFMITDTLLKSFVTPINKDVDVCFCNDSIATFFIDDHDEPIVLIFGHKNGKWKFISSIGLNPIFPLVGMLIDNKIYEGYKHKMTDINHIESELTIFQADNKNRRLNKIEKYDVVFKIDFNLVENPIFKGTAKICTLITEKKTLRND